MSSGSLEYSSGLAIAQPMREPPARTVEGLCVPGFERVREAFIDNFSDRLELGASVCLMRGDTPLVDLWGGHRDTARRKPWTRDTLALIFSNTKAATSLCLHLLLQRAGLDFVTPVSHVWPAFKTSDKRDVTFAHVLSHTSGLCAFRDGVEPNAHRDFDYMLKRIEREAPFWKPGSDVGYQMVTQGWLVGGIIKHLTGDQVGPFFEREIARPLGLDVHIGVKHEDLGRVAPTRLFVPQKNDPNHQFVGGILGGDQFPPALAILHTGISNPNDPKDLMAQLPAHGAVASAAGLCRMLSGFSGGITGPLSGVRVEPFFEQASSSNYDRVFQIPTRFSLGMMRPMDNRLKTPQRGSSFRIPESAFGHAGLGGSFVFADPKAGISMAYVMNRVSGGRLVNARGHALIEAAYESLRVNNRRVF